MELIPDKTKMEELRNQLSGAQQKAQRAEGLLQNMRDDGSRLLVVIQSLYFFH